MNLEEIFKEADSAYNSGDLKKAFSLFLQGAKNGDDSAMTRVACMYADGEGVPYDIERSIYWDQKAV